MLTSNHQILHVTDKNKTDMESEHRCTNFNNHMTLKLHYMLLLNCEFPDTHTNYTLQSDTHFDNYLTLQENKLLKFKQNSINILSEAELTYYLMIKKLL